MSRNRSGKVFISIMLMMALVQTFSIPLASAQIKPWNGNPWEGKPWEGNSWDGSDLEWEGSPWEGSSWEGAPWDGNETRGNPWESNGTRGNPWEGTGTNGSGSNGQGTNGTGTVGSGGNGQYWDGTQWTSLPWYLDPWANNGWSPGGGAQGDTTGGQVPPYGYNPNGSTQPGGGVAVFPGTGNGLNGSASQGSSPYEPKNNTLPYGYEVAKYVTGDIITGQIDMIGDFYQNPDSFRPGPSFFSSIILNGVKVGMGENTPSYINAISDAQEAVLNTVDGIGAANDLRNIRNLKNAESAYSTVKGGVDVAKGASGFSNLSTVASVSKFNVITAAVGAGYSAFELGFKGANAVDVYNSDATGAEKTSAIADATSSAGELLMNAGVVTAAFPGAQVAGGIMVAAGAVIWGASKLTKLVADNWDGIKEFAKDPVGNTKKAVSKGIDKIKGWFS
ncbi:hypothetical protein [Rossellomorea marisflavi]|uniref:hypothetical protein n=1 Tax=Rossellomorea marisflavi TaxID=189381 RepID=UPI00345ADCF7